MSNRGASWGGSTTDAKKGGERRISRKERKRRGYRTRSVQAIKKCLAH